MPEFLDGLESSFLAVYIRQSLWLYPILEIIHILGIVLLVGAAFMFDLRLLGFSKNLPITGMARHLLPWSQRGLVLIVPSGLFLFITNAKALGTDPVFWLKMGLIFIAALNVLVFHKLIFVRYADPKMPENLPFAARICAVVSILVWIAVIACGRLLAY